MQNNAIPILPSMPGWMRSTRYPAAGAVTNVAMGHGVSSNPVITSLYPSEFCRKKGRETIASICAVNEQMEVRIDNLKIGSPSRSSGKRGDGWFSCLWT